jgi:hypothetical protein
MENGCTQGFGEEIAEAHQGRKGNLLSRRAAWPDSHSSDQVNADLLDFLGKSQKKLYSSLNSAGNFTLLGV